MSESRSDREGQKTTGREELDRTKRRHDEIIDRADRLLRMFSDYRRLDGELKRQRK